jgi:hypothetical protein
MLTPVLSRSNDPHLAPGRAAGRRPDRAPRDRAALGAFLSIPVMLIMAVSLEAYADLAPDEVGIDAPVYEVTTPKAELSEMWRYGFYWKGLPVGAVDISGAMETSPSGERLMRVRVEARTNSFIDLLWQYRLEAGGTLRLDPIAPGSYYARETDDTKEAVTKIDFDRTRRVKTFRRKGEKVKGQYEFDAPNTYEFLSTIWLLLNLEYEAGKAYRIDALTGTARYLLQIVAEGREIVEVDGAPVDTFRLRATTTEVTDPENEIAKKHRETHVWVNTDWPRRLLRADVATKWGVVRLELTDVESIAALPAAAPLEESLAPAQQQPAVSAPRTAGPMRPHHP